MSWSSKKQAIGSKSLTKANYIAASTTGAEIMIIWMQRHLGELGFVLNRSSPLLMDKQSALVVIRSPEHHWIQQEVKCQNISIHYVLTDER